MLGIVVSFLTLTEIKPRFLRYQASSLVTVVNHMVYCRWLFI